MRVMNRFLTRACAAAAAGVALSTVAVTGASASGGGGVAARPGALRSAGMVAGPGARLWPVSQDHAIGRVTAGPTNTRYFAGYQTNVAAGSATTVTATFTVPGLACAPSNLGISAIAGEYVNSNLRLTGASVAIKCEFGKAVYFPLLAINGVGTSYRTSPFAAGDVINLSASETTSAATVKVTDVTKGVTKTLTGAGASPRAAFILNDAAISNAGILLGVPNFGKLKFTNCLIDGTALQSLHPQELQRVNHAGVVQIATGPFSPAPAAFATYYKHI
jgi:hypothetical protein